MKRHQFRKLVRILHDHRCGRVWRGVTATVEHDAALGDRSFNTVIDVGANKGQFADYARWRWTGTKLICFEPLPGPWARLADVIGGEAGSTPAPLVKRRGR